MLLHLTCAIEVITLSNYTLHNSKEKKFKVYPLNFEKFFN